MAAAIENKNIEEYEKISDKWLSAILDLDSLLATRREFLLGNWLEPAKKWAANEKEANLYEWNARNLITLWGDAHSGLHDYAQKQWAGMMKDFYYPRWKMLIDQVKKSLVSNKKFSIEEYNKQVIAFEENWTKQENMYPTTATGNSVDKSQNVFDKYLK